MFFQSIHQMIATGTDLSINIRRVKNQLSVAVLPRRTNLKDEAQHLMVPLIFKGTPGELDAEFLQAIMTPVQKAQDILINLESFEKQAELVASQSKAAKSAVEKESKEVREKREKMEKLLKKANEATAGKRYSDALTWFKQAKVLATAEKQKDIDAQMAEVQKKVSEGSLFGMEPIPQPIAPQQSQQIQAPQPQQPMNGIPKQRQPGEQIQMFAEQPMPQPMQEQQRQPASQHIQMQQPIPGQQQWQQPVTMPQTEYLPKGQPQPYNQQWQQPAGNMPPAGQYAGQPQMYVQQLQANGQQWQQSVPQQPQVVTQMAMENTGGREYHSQPQSTDSFSFDKDDESDRELLKEDPYAEYLDFPVECRMKDEAQMELVCC